MRAKLCWLWLAVLLSGCGENGAGSDGPGAASTSDSASTDGSPTAMAATNTGTTATTMGAVSTSSDVGGAVTTTGTGTTGQGGAASVGSIGTSSTTGVAAATVSTSDSSTSASSMSSGGTSTTGGNVSSTGVGGGTGSTTAGAGGTGSVALHPDDAVEFDGHWYRFTQASVGGAEAEATCEGLGGTLACVESEAEDDFLFTLAGTARPWIGLNNEADVNTWVWVNGSPVTYTNWQPGQPDYPDNERWVKIAEDSRWDDGNIASSYICEWES